MKKETILYNAHLVLPDSVIKGSLVIRDGVITAIDEGEYSNNQGFDCNGDYLIPGLVELHTDNLEKYIAPRPGIQWPSISATIIAHDNQVFNSGITTVLDAVALGYADESEIRNKIMEISIQAVRAAHKEQFLRADHYLHFRCELPSKTVTNSFETYCKEPLLKLVSVMDHTPGQRQWNDLSKWRLFHRDEKWTDADANAILYERRMLQATYGHNNQVRISNLCREFSIPVASHDDTIAEDCRAAFELGTSISEFPTTLLAAKEAKKLGMEVIMGAPNLVRGTSHSGNISARDLAENDLLDGFSSDYMPISLLHAAFLMHFDLDTPLNEAIAKVSLNNASMVGLADRGALTVHRIADIVRVRVSNNLPIVRTIWKRGRLLLDSSH